MSVATFILSNIGIDQNTITRFVQSASPDGIEAGIEAALAEIIALNVGLQDPNKYGLAALDLAGGGDGHTFVAQITFTTDLENALYKIIFGITAPSALLDGSHAGAYLASDESELVLAQDVAYARLRTFDTQGHQFSVLANAFAGASKGTRFMGLVVGFAGTP